MEPIPTAEVTHRNRDRCLTLCVRAWQRPEDPRSPADGRLCHQHLPFATNRTTVAFRSNPTIWFLWIVGRSGLQVGCGQIDATLHGDLGTILDWAAEKREELAETRALKHQTDTSLVGVSV